MTKIDLKTAGPFIALVALFIIGIFVNDAFLSAGNVSNILARSSFIGIVAIGATFVITTGGIDLSVGSMAAFISGCMILLMNALMSTFDSLITIIFLAIIASAAIGALAGMINGLLTTKAKIEAFIVTLGTMGIYRSLVTYMADGGTLSLNFTIGDVYSEVYYGTLLGLPYPVWVFLAVAIIG
ncbi:MAG: ABC transporter permease, partial [Gammaproteobacteria bacterium]|nr:ABC transporter permease [Gammaproteobacteria bacterium]